MGRILLIDDEPDIVFVIRRALEKAGYAVETATDPMQAIENFKASYFDLIVTDIRMPKINGFQLYREIRKRDASVKFAFMTAFDIYQQEFSKVFKSTEVRLFFKKPVSVIELTNQIGKELE